MSKEFEALQDLSKLVFIYGGVQQYQIIEKSLKALEIIKNKEVNVQELFDFIKKYGEHNGLYIYNGHRPYGKRINEEEFDLLKEVLL